MTVLVRETAQNSWDARKSDDLPVSFSVNLTAIPDAVRHLLRDEVFPGARRVIGTNLAKTLDSPGLKGLFISDRNTKGLGGPVRADVLDPTGSYDWVDFVLNVGKANHQVKTGGTYGFGKTISFVVSQANTILIHSRTEYDRQPTTRLIASAIGDKFNDGSSNFTGRHWWGNDVDGVPTPIVGEMADTLASEIGFPPFLRGEYGTTILILAPAFGGRTPEQAMNFLVESALWHLWPKLVAGATGLMPMELKFVHNGEPVPVPSFASTPPLSKYVDAFLGLRSPEDRPLGYLEETLKRHAGGSVSTLGRLATVPFVREQRRIVDDGHDPEDDESPPPASPFGNLASHHVALMRSPELVVAYLPGPEAPDSSLEWGGVFRADEALDGVFAKAEPPTHDSWTPDYLEDKQDRLVVQKCLRDIRKLVEGRWGSQPQPEATSALSTALVADALSHLVVGSPGAGRGRPEKPPIPRTRKAAAQSELISNWTDVIQRDDDLVSVASFTLNSDASRPTKISVAVGVALEGSQRDVSLDENLALRAAWVDSEVISLVGLNASFTIEPKKSCEILLEAACSGRTSVLWEVKAGPADEEPE
ncbi:hypothetical protein RI444_05280 [Paenarthrobacter sp. AT5]|uniref:hypothetical protein n=1 Tax=Paenarthrobacter TaxID=1742992 RepID=UPI001A9898D3|nr:MULTISPECIES: hypothetical protein [Paenarthrobacter]WOC62055.1 hypothetical protein RI444_05280 [Paenarthrobacter sp. AT5]